MKSLHWSLVGKLNERMGTAPDYKFFDMQWRLRDRLYVRVRGPLQLELARWPLTAEKH